MNKYNTSKGNYYLAIGSLSGFVYFGIGHFIPLPDILEGFCLGIFIALYPIGFYSLRHDISRLQAFKRKLARRTVNIINKR